MKKPVATLIGQDGNIFNLIAIASKALQKADQKNQAKEMRDRIYACSSYEDALCIIGEYVEIR